MEGGRAIDALTTDFTLFMQMSGTPSADALKACFARYGDRLLNIWLVTTNIVRFGCPQARYTSNPYNSRLRVLKLKVGTHTLACRPPNPNSTQEQRGTRIRNLLIGIQIRYGHQRRGRGGGNQRIAS